MLPKFNKYFPFALLLLLHHFCFSQSLVQESRKTKNKLSTSEGTKGRLIFQTGFEGTSHVIRDAKNYPGVITPGYAIDEMEGADNTLREKSDWVKDLDNAPDGGQFLFEYTGGDTTQRTVRIIPEPGRPKNHVLQFWLNDSWEASEHQRKARIQADIYEIKKGTKNFTNRCGFFYRPILPH